MQTGRFNIVVDGQWGSAGKGLIAPALAARYRPEMLTTTNMSNAGHVAVNIDGTRYVAKALPSPAILHRWLEDYNPQIFVGPSAAFDIDQLLYEIKETQADKLTTIHPRAGVINKKHKEIEADLQHGTKYIASTMQGCGAFLADKIMRRKELKLARDYEVLHTYMLNGLPMPLILYDAMKMGRTILHEGSQGFSLDINHGSHYPFCTSRGTTAMQVMADMGVNHNYAGDIYLVIRPYPIRVGSIVKDGETIGYSGDCYSDHKEITWQEVAESAGAPPEVMKGELTTVTKRLRRVFSLSEQQLKEAALINGATKIALNFANYIDWSCFGTSEFDKLPPKVIQFIAKIEMITNLPVDVVGTGPQINHVCFRSNHE